MKALGMIEVYGYLAAVEALDSALKAADVGLVEVKKVTGGLVTVMVAGDVGAVKAAIDAAASAVEKVGRVVSIHVIPSPADELELIIGPQRAMNSEQENREEETPSVKAWLTEKQEEEAPPRLLYAPEATQDGITQLTADTMLNMTVARLRSAARDLGVSNMTKKDIRYAKKEELVQAILKHLEQER